MLRCRTKLGEKTIDTFALMWPEVKTVNLLWRQTTILSNLRLCTAHIFVFRFLRVISFCASRKGFQAKESWKISPYVLTGSLCRHEYHMTVRSGAGSFDFRLFDHIQVWLSSFFTCYNYPFYTCLLEFCDCFTLRYEYLSSSHVRMLSLSDWNCCLWKRGRVLRWVKWRPKMTFRMQWKEVSLLRYMYCLCIILSKKCWRFLAMR